MYYVYKIQTPSNKCYVGVTNDMHRRLLEHRKSPYPIGHALRKYKDNILFFCIASYSTLEEAYQKEATIVDEPFVNSNNTYNVSLGGGIPQGALVKERHRLAMNKVGSDGLTPSQRIARNRDFYEGNNPNALAVTLDGVTYDSKTQACRLLSMSAPTLDKALQGVPIFQRTTGKDHHTSRAVEQRSLEGDFIARFDCIKHAYEAIGRKYGCSISDCCRGRQKSAHGYVWKYI